MNNKKQKYLVIDVETANSLEQPLVYDIGFAVTDNTGKIYYKRSYVVPEIFFDMEQHFNDNELMNSAYYADKLPKYYEGLQTGKWEVKPLKGIFFEIRGIMKEYRIKKVAAYNAHFDVNALNTTLRYVTESAFKYFFPYKTEVNCIWHMACQTLFTQKRFLKTALVNGWQSESGNVQTSAEIAHRYLTGNYEFEEAHTGLEDVIIEAQIMAKCFAQKKKMSKKINRLCWRIPQKEYKKLRMAAAA